MSFRGKIPPSSETYPDTSVGRILDGFQQWIIDRIKAHGKCTIHNATVEVCTEIDLHDITLVQDHLVAGVRGVVCSTVVDTETTRETHATLDVVTLLETLVAGQSPHRVLNALGNLRQGLARLDILLRILADLAVDFGTLPVFPQEILVHAIKVPLLFVGGAVGIVVLVLDDLALRVLAVGEQVRYGDSRRRALDLGATLLLLLGLALLLLFGGCRSTRLIWSFISGENAG